MIEKSVCRDCFFQVDEGMALSAPSPFDPEGILIACPNCKLVGHLVMACDEPGCWSESSRGTPTVIDGKKAYRNTCGKHPPELRWVDSPSEEPLGKEFKDVLDDNLWNLVVRS